MNLESEDCTANEYATVTMLVTSTVLTSTLREAFKQDI